MLSADDGGTPRDCHMQMPLKPEMGPEWEYSLLFPSKIRFLFKSCLLLRSYKSFDHIGSYDLRSKVGLSASTFLNDL